MLKSAKLTANVDEKEELIVSALQLCKSVANAINLHVICSEFTALKAYHAVLDLCVSCAKKADPENAAERFYKYNASEHADRDGYHRYMKRFPFLFAVKNTSYLYFIIFRMEIYKEVINMLDYIFSQGYQNQSQTDLNTSNFGSQVQNVSQQINQNQLVKTVKYNSIATLPYEKNF